MITKQDKKKKKKKKKEENVLYLNSLKNIKEKENYIFKWSGL
jgi:hypothetical protein